MVDDRLRDGARATILENDDGGTTAGWVVVLGAAGMAVVPGNVIGGGSGAVTPMVADVVLVVVVKVLPTIGLALIDKAAVVGVVVVPRAVASAAATVPGVNTPVEAGCRVAAAASGSMPVVMVPGVVPVVSVIAVLPLVVAVVVVVVVSIRLGFRLRRLGVSTISGWIVFFPFPTRLSFASKVGSSGISYTCSGGIRGESVVLVVGCRRHTCTCRYQRRRRRMR